MKDLLKRCCADVMSKRGVVGRRSRVAVLCYHSVEADPRFSLALFRRHLEWLTEHCEVIRFSAVTEAVRGAERARPVVAITFDDGYLDNYEHAFPLLVEYGLPATFFVTAGLMERDAAVLARFRVLRGLEEVESLEWSQVLEMRDAGAEFGAHTYSHPNLVRLGSREVEAELRRSRDIIEERLGESVTMLAYPFGKPRRHYTSQTVSAARAMGYEIGATTVLRGLRASDDPMTLPRLLVGGDDVVTLREKLAGSWNFLGQWHEHAPVWAARLFSPDDFRV